MGFGCMAGDFDADGDEDVAVANGHVVHHPRNAPVKELPLLLANAGEGRFERIPAETLGGYFAEPAIGRGLATGDVDRDGLLDLVFVNTNAPAALLYNRSGSVDRKTGGGLHVRLIGTTSNRDAIGAWAELVTSDGVQVRHVLGGGSYLSTSELALNWHWSNDATPQELTVHWPSGIVSAIPLGDDAAANLLAARRVQIIEPAEAGQDARWLPWR